MHRLINQTPDGKQTDHINGKKWDNRKKNLRTVSNQQNRTNTAFSQLSWKRKYLPGVSVRIKGESTKFRAMVTYKENTYFLGYYDTELEAHEQYILAKQRIKDHVFHPNAFSDSGDNWDPRLDCTKPKPPRKYPPGVDRSKNRFRATIEIDGKRVRLGYFDTPEAAHERYLAECRKLGRTVPKLSRQLPGRGPGPEPQNTLF